MEATIKINNFDCVFKLVYSDIADRIILKCNEWNVITISPKGISRFKGCPSNMFKTESDGKIAMRTQHVGMRDYRSTGSRDVALKLVPKTTEIYVRAIDNLGDEVDLLYIDSVGLYLWIADMHSRNCYAMAKSNTPLLLE